MKKIYFLLLMIPLFLGCNREGQTGELTLTLFPKHHEQPIKGATVYVRFGAKELSGTSPTDFDLAVIGDSTDTKVQIKNLWKGDYYVYATGYDSAFSQIVSGGMHVKLKGKTGETEKDLAVTE